MGLFDKIRGPLSIFFGKGKNLLPSDILGHGLLATALGGASLDAYYLAKNVVPGPTNIVAASPMLLDESDSELQRLSTGPNENYAENQKFVQYLSGLEVKNNLPQ